MAWNTGRLVMTGFHAPKKFPGFDKFRGKRKGPRARQDWREMKAQVLVFHLMNGGEPPKG